MNLYDIYLSLAPCVGQVLAEKYPQLGAAVLEVIGGASALYRLIAVLKGEQAAGSPGILGKIMGILGTLGLNPKK